MIIQVSPEHSAHHPVGMVTREIKWSRALRVVVALASVTVSWVAVFGLTYLIVQFF